MQPCRLCVWAQAGWACLAWRAGRKCPPTIGKSVTLRKKALMSIPGRTFKEVTNKDGHVTGVRTVDVNFRGFIEGRPDFDEIPGTETVIPCDVVIFAIGQKPDLDLVKQ